VGIATVVLGGGRERKEDSVDHAVGVVLHKKVGDEVGMQEPICTLHYNDESRANRAEHLIRQSYRIENGAAKARPLVQGVIQS
jgi:pyrimidine-nucleoside phosphorylase